VSVRIQAQVRAPPAYYIGQFRAEMQRVLSTWAAVARALGAAGHDLEITSWWRDFRPVGGATYSQHLVGTAIDALSPRLTRAQLLPLVQRAARLYGTSAPTKASERSGRSVHVQVLPVGTVATLVRQGILARAESFVGPPQPLS